MPMYEFSCEKCGFQFERLMRLPDPNPPCPNPGVFKHPDWDRALLEWAQDFESGRSTRYPGMGAQKLGPDAEHTVIGNGTPSVTRTLRDWVGEIDGSCGGATKKLISKSDFHLKGGGWAADGY